MHAFGDQAVSVARLADEGFGARLHPEHPYIEAEVVYAARCEFAEHASDVLTRRTPLALLDNAAAQAAVPRVVALMGEVHGWSQERRDAETKSSIERLQTSL